MQNTDGAVKWIARFWARGFYVTTVGLDEDSVRKYIKHQEKDDQRVDQLRLL
jgi:putative transposase